MQTIARAGVHVCVCVCRGGSEMPLCRKRMVYFQPALLLPPVKGGKNRSRKLGRLHGGQSRNFTKFLSFMIMKWGMFHEGSLQGYKIHSRIFQSLEPSPLGSNPVNILAYLYPMQFTFPTFRVQLYTFTKHSRRAMKIVLLHAISQSSFLLRATFQMSQMLFWPANDEFSSLVPPFVFKNWEKKIHSEAVRLWFTNLLH